MTTEVRAFTCDFCPRKKRYATRHNAHIHEDRCFFNPVRQACASCKFFTYIKHYSEADTGYSEGGPVCELDYLNRTPGEPELRSECDKWERREIAEGK